MSSSVKQFLATFLAIICALGVYEWAKKPQDTARKQEIANLKKEAASLNVEAKKIAEKTLEIENNRLQAAEEQNIRNQAATAVAENAQASALAKMTEETEKIKLEAKKIADKTIEIEVTRQKVAEEQIARFKTAGLIAEGVQAAAMAKIAVAEYQQTENKLPKNNREAGLAAPEQYQGRALTRMEITAGGIINLHYNENSGTPNGLIRLTPSAKNVHMPVTWACTSPNIKGIALLLPQCEYVG
jgi:Pilin (bacterial filament)